MVIKMPTYTLWSGRVNKGHPGILIVSEQFEFICNIANKARSMFWYYCKNRRSKGLACPARASLVRCLGEGEPQFVLRSWSGEKEHSHPGYLAGSVAEQIKQEMCQLVQVNINTLQIQTCEKTEENNLIICYNKDKDMQK